MSLRKPINVTQLNDGMTETAANQLFDKIENFAAYSFNKSHSCAYSMLSYWCMWLKEYYPSAFFAATLSALGEDKLEGLVRDARTHGLEVFPPDINRSTGRFEIRYEASIDKTVLLTPFHRCKSVSEVATQLILSVREKDGEFIDYEDFKKRMPKKLNTRQRSVLDKVGAFAKLKKDPKSASHPDRRKDQMELMPGLIIDNVRSARPDIPVSACKDALIKEVLVPALRGCDKCSLAGGVHPTPRLGKRAKFMVVTDCPNWGEEAASKMLEGKPNESLRHALKQADLSVSDGYFTSMVKSPKADKTLTNEQINGCLPYLLKEIEILKPPVIVALGGLVARQLVPDLTNVDDAVGRVVYDAKMDANIVVGFSPLRIHFDASKQDQLEEIFRKVAELIE